MTYFRFGIRDLHWAMALIGMALGWWLDRSALHARYYPDVKAVQQLIDSCAANRLPV